MLIKNIPAVKDIEPYTKASLFNQKHSLVTSTYLSLSVESQKVGCLLQSFPVVLEVDQEIIHLCLTDFSTFPAYLLERLRELALQNSPKVRQFDDFTLYITSSKGIPVLSLPSRQRDEEALGDTAGPTNTPADVGSEELHTND